jgi:two-component system cell cycle sensor histidine kinase/response regulator CckA
MADKSSMFASIRSLATGHRDKPAARALRVLVVDDEETIRRFVERVLRDAGYDIVLASSGKEALAATQGHGPFDLLLTDLMMPEMTGDELARQMRQAEPKLKVLYLTGFSDHLFKEKVTLWEDEAFLDKPCSIQGLLEAVSLLARGSLKAS